MNVCACLREAAGLRSFESAFGEVILKKDLAAKIQVGCCRADGLSFTGRDPDASSPG